MKLLLGLLLALSLTAQTKLFMRDSASPLGTASTEALWGGCNRGSSAIIWLQANTTQGSGTPSAVFAPTSTAPPCIPQTADTGGNALQWISAPLSSGVTISSNINYSVGCAESATAMNLAVRFVVRRWSRLNGGINGTVHTSAITTECGTSLALRTITAAAPTSTVFAVGDRVVIEVQLMNVGTWGGNSTRTATIGYDGTAGGTRDTFANFADTLSFASDTNNTRPILGNLFDALKLWRDRWLV